MMFPIMIVCACIVLFVYFATIEGMERDVQEERRERATWWASASQEERRERRITELQRELAKWQSPAKAKAPDKTPVATFDLAVSAYEPSKAAPVTSAPISVYEPATIAPVSVYQ